MYLGSKIKRVGDVDKYFLGIDETLTSVAGINILWETSTNIKYSGIFIEVSWTEQRKEGTKIKFLWLTG